MIFIFYILAAMLIFLSYKSFRGGIDYLNYFKKELAKPRSKYAPFATIIVPCKGLDEGLSENLRALLEQDYANYEVIFVVDDKADPAVGVIEEVSRKDAKTANTVVAPRASISSQKVENLREAVLYVSDASKIFVFVDSDTRPAKDWLRHLVEPLEDENIGAATGYRWFISKKPTFASEVRSIWNASIASALGPNMRSNFCWGGSMAIRRDTFERLDIRERWRGTLSDDFTVTRAMNAARLPVYFVPKALSASIENCTFRELLEFTNRQMKITRVYAPHLWKLSFFGSVIFNTAMLTAFLILILSRQNGIEVAAAITTIVLVTFFSIGKSWLRLKAVRLALPQYRARIDRQFLSQNALWVAAPALFLINCVAAMFSRRINWRGTTYEMVSPNTTKII